MIGVINASKPVLLKVNPDEVIIDGEYDFWSIDGNSSVEIVFKVMKISDYKIFIGEIDPSGTISTLDKTIDNKVLV